jgi:hypothetical protein
MKSIFIHQKASLTVFRKYSDFAEALRFLNNHKINIFEIRTPYEIDVPDAATSRFSRSAGKISFWSGCTGFVIGLAALLLFHLELPIIYSTKTVIPVLSFIIPLFLFTVLFAALGLFIAFSIQSQLIPGQLNFDLAVDDEDAFIIISEEYALTEVDKLAASTEKINFVQQGKKFPFPIKLNVG